jgi:cell division protein FtsB
VFDTEKLGSYIPGLSLRRVAVVTCVFVVVYSGFTIAGNATRSFELNAQTRQLQRDIAGQQKQYAELEALRRYMQSDAFIETAARQEGLAVPGDTAIVVTAPTQPAETQTEPSGAWWERYFGR